MLSVQPSLRGSNDVRVGRKMATFQLFFFQSMEQVVVRRGQIRRIGRVIKSLEAQINVPWTVHHDTVLTLRRYQLKLLTGYFLGSWCNLPWVLKMPVVPCFYKVTERLQI
jgi:hypothetical protein